MRVHISVRKIQLEAELGETGGLALVRHLHLNAKQGRGQLDL